jgi:hypothetical protein
MLPACKRKDEARVPRPLLTGPAARAACTCAACCVQADAAAAETAAKAPLLPPSLQEDLTLPGGCTPAPAAAPVLSVLQASPAMRCACVMIGHA